MNSDRKWVFIGIILVFISGMIAGVAVERKVLHCHFERRDRPREKFSKEQILDRLTKELSLTEEQRKSVGNIFDSHKPEFKALHKQIRNNMKQLVGTIDQEIINVLDEKQKKKYEIIMKKRDRHRPKDDRF